MNLKKIEADLKAEKIQYKTRSFRLPVDLVKRLEATAKKLKTNSNDLLRRILEGELGT